MDSILGGLFTSWTILSTDKTVQGALVLHTEYPLVPDIVSMMVPKRPHFPFKSLNFEMCATI